MGPVRCVLWSCERHRYIWTRVCMRLCMYISGRVCVCVCVADEEIKTSSWIWRIELTRIVKWLQRSTTLILLCVLTFAYLFIRFFFFIYIYSSFSGGGNGEADFALFVRIFAFILAGPTFHFSFYATFQQYSPSVLRMLSVNVNAEIGT